MKTNDKKKTKFIASIDDNSKTESIEELAKALTDDGIKVEHVSSMLGYISGKADTSLEALQNKYKSKGLNIEADKEVGVR